MASEGEAHAASADVDAPAPVKGTGDGGTVCSSGGCGTAGAESCAASTKPAKRRARARLANQIPDSIMHNEQLSAAIAKVGGGVCSSGGAACISRGNAAAIQLQLRDSEDCVEGATSWRQVCCASVPRRPTTVFMRDRGHH